MERNYWLAISYLLASKPQALGKLKEKGPEEILKDFGKQEIETAISTGLSEIKSSNIEFVCQDDERYPKKLFDLECPPTALFVFGGLPETQDLVAMVGTRKASPHGIGIARNMAFEFSKTGIVVVSGMADGIDSASHWGALDTDKPTIAILGCGINQARSATQRELKKRISVKGAIVSEFPPNFPGDRWTFPWRNRIIAALSKACLVIEAPKSSGALITARDALDLGRYVLACPGLPGMQNFEGCNKLIKDGALLVDSPSDVLSLYGKTTLYTDESLSETEKAILLACAVPCRIDEICDKTDLNAEALLGIITVLDIKGLVIKLPNGFYASRSFSDTKTGKN